MVQAFVDKLGALFKGEAKWYKLPKLLGLIRLVLIRNELREKNLHDTEDGPLTGPPCDGVNTGVRTLDGTCNDLASTRMGAAGTRFGRNFPLEHVWPDEKRLLSPSPRKVSLDLMTRQAFQPATILNLTAASWIQFMTHDWFDHGRDKSGKRMIEVPLDPGDPWPEHPMRVPRTPLDPTRSADSPKPPTFVNEVTHWWDASQIYGIDPTTAIKRRTGTDGKIRVGSDGKLPLDPALGVDLTGFNDNWWIGLSMLHGLFALEHNAICERLKAEYRHLGDEEIMIVRGSSTRPCSPRYTRSNGPPRSCRIRPSPRPWRSIGRGWRATSCKTSWRSSTTPSYWAGLSAPRWTTTRPPTR